MADLDVWDAATESERLELTNSPIRWSNAIETARQMSLRVMAMLGEMDGSNPVQGDKQGLVFESLLAAAAATVPS
eukprot:1471995-Amphidinium_carterae.1